MREKGKTTGIKSWPKDDRPREKLLKNGEQSLSNSELLAILLRSGIKGNSAIDLARQILDKFGAFRNMSHTDIREELCDAGKLMEIKVLDHVVIGDNEYFSFAEEGIMV